MGCIGMSMEDFCRCTPSEFNNIYNEWDEYRGSMERGKWERTRIEAMCSLLPYNPKLKGRDILTFPWDKDEEPEENPEEKGMSSKELMEKWYGGKEMKKIEI